MKELKGCGFISVYNTPNQNESQVSNSTTQPNSTRTSSQSAAILLPIIEFEYPLTENEMSVDDPQSRQEKLVTQIYPLYEKDFFVNFDIYFS